MMEKRVSETEIQDRIKSPDIETERPSIIRLPATAKMIATIIIPRR